ncbi:MAG: hypothetical protein ACFB4I_20565 [Cyanophyceae cyanobacterium]
MERFTSSLISTLLIAAASPAVQASETTLNAATLNNIKPALTETSPNSLVHLAHRGYFANQGIPSSKALVAAYSLGNISAEDLVQAGVETGRVMPDITNNRGYINAVDSMLNNLTTR